MAATGITESAPGISQARQFALRHRWKPYVTPQELKDSIPLDVSIQNYDSAYHIISTNVKTIQQFSPEGAGARDPRTTLLNWGRDCAAVHGGAVASRQAFGAEDCLAGNQHHPAMNLSTPQLLEDFVHLRQGTGRNFAVNFSCRRHR